MLDPVIFMRPSLAEEEELQIARSSLPTYTIRTAIPENSLVVGRYSVLPYYEELEWDLRFNRSQLINSWHEHNFVADMAQWYPRLKDRTPKTFFSLEEFKTVIDPNAFIKAKDCTLGPWVLKGATNSKKHQWNTHMFAERPEDVDAVYKRLCEDSLINEQNIYIREYVPLRQFGVGVRGLPITEEYRFFVLDGHIVGSGYYWSQFPEEREKHCLGPWLVDQKWLRESINRVKNHIRFFVMDVARKADGGWMVVELNDGCMSGLCEVPANVLYTNIRQQLLRPRGGTQTALMIASATT